MKIQIKHYLTGNVLFVHEVEGNTMAITLRHAVAVGADLTGADLPGQKLAGIDLSYGQFAHANLCKANLRGCNLTCVNFTHTNLQGADLRDTCRQGVYTNAPTACSCQTNAPIG